MIAVVFVETVTVERKKELVEIEIGSDTKNSLHRWNLYSVSRKICYSPRDEC